ncbi:MAG TPA: hypothetical protein VF466_03320 [Candidatus Saccharimonadales bacterium]
MFGHDDNGQTTTDAAAPGVVQDGGLGASNNMDVTTAGADAAVPTSFGPGFAAAEPAAPAAAPAPVIEPEVAAPAASVIAAPAAGDDADDLLQIKQQALQQLSPLVGHLDQSPEEKFRTTMMMIQASDNQELIKDAYSAAQAIEDEKTRAQALLDIINEINYFTQQHQQA